MSYDISLSVPRVNQLTSGTSDGRPNENAGLDCGESCLSSVIEYMTGVRLLPDEIKDIIWSLRGLTPETAGPTSHLDLKLFLTARTDITPVDNLVTTRGQAMKVLRDAIKGQGLPVIGLSSFSAPHTTPFHWKVADGIAGPDDTHTDLVRGMNPWGAYEFQQSNAEYFDWLADNYPVGGVSYIMSFTR